MNVVRADPVRSGLLYAGTEKRRARVVRRRRSAGSALQLNLPVTSVRDIDVHGDDLVIATHGRAFWILDDVTPLRQVDRRPGRRGAWLFKPATAIRVRPDVFTGTPMPKDEPLAPNPPAGAYVDYVVPAGTAREVTLEILDAQNNLVRRYSSSDPVARPNLQRLTVAPEWFVTPPSLQTTPGMHRFVWPLRYAAAAGLAAGRRGGEGVWAPPGEYTVALTVGTQRLTQPLTVAPDPRVKLPAAAYAEQFALARQVETTRVAWRGRLTKRGP